MDDLFDKAGTYLLSLGLPGICIIALVVAVYKLFNMYNECQEKRITESQANLVAVFEMRSAIESLKASMETLVRVQASIK